MERCITCFDKNNEYIKKAQPLLEKLDELSRAYNIPYFFSAAVGNTKEKTEYMTKCRTAIPMGILLTNDNIVDFLLVRNGFKPCAPATLPDIEL